MFPWLMLWGKRGDWIMLFFAILGYAFCVLVLARVVPCSTVVAVATPLGMGWVSWGQITSGSAFFASHVLGFAIAGWAALVDLKRIVHFLRSVQWRVLWYMARGKVIELNEFDEDEELDEDRDTEEARA